MQQRQARRRTVEATSTAGRVPPDTQKRMVELRRDLHRHPELSGHERETARRIAANSTASASCTAPG